MIEGTLLDNITMGLNDTKVDKVRVGEAIRLASADTFIGKTLPLALHTRPAGRSVAFAIRVVSVINGRIARVVKGSR